MDWIPTMRKSNMKILLLLTVTGGIALNLVLMLFTIQLDTLWQLPAMFLGPSFLGLTVVNLGAVVPLWKTHRFMSFIPFFLALLFLALVVPCTFLGQRIRMDIFRRRLPQYEEVILMMKDGTIHVDNELTHVKLPRGFRHLGKTAFAHIDTDGVLTVEFIIGSGFPNQHAAYLYRSKGSIKEWEFGHRWPRPKKIDENWYFSVM